MSTCRDAWRTRVPAPRWTFVALLAWGLAACTPAAAPGDASGAGIAAPTRTAENAADDAHAQAHAALARRLRGFPIERGPPPRSPRAADDERFRLGAFWRARSDTHYFGPDFTTRADAMLAQARDTPADAALQALRDVVDARLPAWQSLVDYNASGRMRDDDGDGGRERLPGAIAALDAIEAAVWTYLDAVDAETGSAGSAAR